MNISDNWTTYIVKVCKFKFHCTPINSFYNNKILLNVVSSEREARAVMEKVTSVVKYLHQNGVVHR